MLCRSDVLTGTFALNLVANTLPFRRGVLTIESVARRE
jgi:hypothetical protein